MKMNRIYSLLLLALVTLLSSCSNHMSFSDALTPPEETVNHFIGDGSGEKVDLLIVEAPSVMDFAEGMWAPRQNLYFWHDGIKDNDQLSEAYLPGLRVSLGGKAYYVFSSEPGTVAYEEMVSYFGSRAKGGKLHQYGPDGQVYGNDYHEKVVKFGWDKLRPLGEYKETVSIHRNVDPDSDLYKKILASLLTMLEKIEGKIPNEKMTRILEALPLSSDKILLIANLSQLGNFYMAIGMPVFEVLEAIIGVQDLSKYVYETSSISKFELALISDGLQGQIVEIGDSIDSFVEKGEIALARQNEATEKQNAVIAISCQAVKRIAEKHGLNWKKIAGVNLNNWCK